MSWSVKEQADSGWTGWGSHAGWWVPIHNNSLICS